MEQSKVCFQCGKEKKLSKFHKHSGMSDGHLNKCASCVGEYVKSYYKKNPIRKVWQHMIERCTNPQSAYYHRYGGRGIKVCKRWLSFENFRTDMEDTYKAGLELDRIDNNGHYTPKNCRWVTRKENARNSSIVRKIPAFGKIMCIIEWAEETGIPQHTILARLDKLNWSPEKALSIPVRKMSKRKEIKAFGKIQKMGVWSKEFDIPIKILSNRINKLNWSPEKALTTPISRRY